MSNAVPGCSAHAVRLESWSVDTMLRITVGPYAFVARWEE
ncbi:MAG: hypothetical protein QOF73_3319, partial [Thermomicrobiales bacterium]|nr:hypothetical protein [Thermomicrobiales bacterium]